MEGTCHQTDEAARLQSCRYESPPFLLADFDGGVQGFEGSCEPQGRQQRIITAGQGLLIIAGDAAAAKSLQSCPTLCDPVDGSPPGSPVPGILQARTLEWVAISVSNA